MPAAFRRLCVETAQSRQVSGLISQPPSGGCVLKRLIATVMKIKFSQPPSGGCVLKLQNKQNKIG